MGRSHTKKIGKENPLPQHNFLFNSFVFYLKMVERKDLTWRRKVNR